MRVMSAVGLPLPALLLMGGCQPGVLDPAGPVGAAERSILTDSMLIMLAIGLPTMAAALGCATWFRKTNPRAKYDPNWTYSGRVELVIWGIPLLTIVLLGGVSWVGSHQLDPARPLTAAQPVLEVQVVSMDWKWLFIYPGQNIASVNELVLPTDVPVHFSLTSSSVMNAFFVPQLGSMIYTMNGMRSELHLMADRPGEFRGISAHYSGDGFSDMHFAVRAVSPDEFRTWVATAPAAGRLDTGTYARLARPSSRLPAAKFGPLEDGLFDRIVEQRIAPAPGPGDTPVSATHRPEH